MEVKQIKQTVWLPIGSVVANEGQIVGVPANPRRLMKDEYEFLKRSIKDDPEMMDLNELIVYECGGVYVVLGGNMRYKACVELGWTEVPCKIEEPGTDVKILRGHVIKDNADYGENDEELLASEWDPEELEDWGIIMAKQGEEETIEEKSSLKLTFTPEQFTYVKKELNKIDKDNSVALLTILGYGEEGDEE